MYPIKTKEKYDSNNLEKTWNIFTTAYLWNYISWDFNEWVWSHCWVDLFPQKTHDDVIACLPWVIDVAGSKDVNWNYIIIKHENALDPNDNTKTTTLYSCHLHLSEILVKKWDVVKEGDIIGKTWNTGNVSWSTWEHLHFQIDTKDAPFHPYWPFTFAESQAAWLWFFDAVNKWLWIDNARKYTVNPLVYLDSIGKWFDTVVWVDTSSNNEAPKAIETSNTLVADKNNSVSDVNTLWGNKYFKDTNEEYINYLYETWITKWYSDGTFRWENEISRVELLAMVFTFAKIPVDPNLKADFTDIDSSAWYYKYITTASNKKIINWYEDKTFKPNNPVTRIEAIAIILNSILWKDKIPSLAWSLFIDIESWSWYEKYVYYIAQNGLMDIDWNKFYPNSNIKRKEVAQILYNLK